MEDASGTKEGRVFLVEHDATRCNLTVISALKRRQKPLEGFVCQPRSVALNGSGLPSKYFSLLRNYGIFQGPGAQSQFAWRSLYMKPSEQRKHLSSSTCLHPILPDSQRESCASQAGFAFLTDRDSLRRNSSYGTPVIPLWLVAQVTENLTEMEPTSAAVRKLGWTPR